MSSSFRGANSDSQASLSPTIPVSTDRRSHGTQFSSKKFKESLLMLMLRWIIIYKPIQCISNFLPAKCDIIKGDVFSFHLDYYDI